MKKVLKSAAVACAILALVGCNKDPESSQRKGAFKVDTLFNHDGCTLYRFEDGTQTVYYAKCQQSSSAMYNSGSAKHPDYINAQTGYE